MVDAQNKDFKIEIMNMFKELKMIEKRPRGRPWKKHSLNNIMKTFLDMKVKFNKEIASLNLKWNKSNYEKLKISIKTSIVRLINRLHTWKMILNLKNTEEEIDSSG